MRKRHEYLWKPWLFWHALKSSVGRESDYMKTVVVRGTILAHLDVPPLHLNNLLIYVNFI